MKNIFTALLFFISISLFSQEEKRLALVIGNANYDKGELKNPVNDARLIASTLDSLDFDVILKENLATKRDMTTAIREFGSKRSDYDVAFVYYAGHGIQVDDENFLLPTEEIFEEEFDVLDYGVSVQNIMRYLRAQTNEVNILILDACRDNPFESNWNTTRSLKGSGLAKIPAPTGSLIAFSTDSGQTAPDGDGDNSTYTVSLAKNMLLEDTSIDQVFRNVRAEVLAQTDGIQRPVEATQLTGQTFYLSPSKFEDEFNKIDENLIKKINLEKNIELCNIILSKSPENYNALRKKAITLAVMGEMEESNQIFKNLYEKKPDDYTNLFSWIYHENYSRTNFGLLNEVTNQVDLDSPEIKIFDSITNHMDLNKHPILNFIKLRNFHNTTTNQIYDDAFKEKLMGFLETAKRYSDYEIQEDVNKHFISKNIYKTNPREYYLNRIYYYIFGGLFTHASANDQNYDELIQIYENHMSSLENMQDPEPGFFLYYLGVAYRANGDIDTSTRLYLDALQKYSNSGQVMIDAYLELINNYLQTGNTDTLTSTALEAEYYMEQNANYLSSYAFGFYSTVKTQLLKILFMIDNNFIDSIKLTDSLIKIFENDEKIFNMDINEIFNEREKLWIYYNQYILNISLGRLEIASKLQDKFEKILDKYKSEFKDDSFELSKILIIPEIKEDITSSLIYYNVNEFEDEELKKIMENHNNNEILKLYEEINDKDYSVLNTYLVNYILNNNTQKRLLNWSKKKNIDLRDLRIFYINTLNEMYSGGYLSL
tara:strand:+ start:34 stop:2340 length:2307 start_codon:yes stop_codon:yes gene_type:complete